MKLGWCVFMHTPEGALMPIIGFWRKRKALRWAKEREDLQGPLEVYRCSWGSSGATGRPAAADLNLRRIHDDAGR